MNKVIESFLTPLSFAWNSVYRLRRFSYHYGFLHTNKFAVPIISIGNLTFGGTGKTPFTLWLANFMAERGKRSMILTRGYKGKLERERGILRSDIKLGFNPVEYGDEAILLARRLKNGAVVVGKNRSDNLKKYFSPERPDVVFLDDGHQHLKIHRDLNIVLFDALLPLERYRVAPLGYLREGPTALKDADIIVIGHCDQVDKGKVDKLEAWIKKYCSEKISFVHISYKTTGIFDTNYLKVSGPSLLAGKRVIAFSGIASPNSFFAMLAKLGAELVRSLAFDDHHYFTYQEIETLIDMADKANALLITTEKDIVKVRRVYETDKIRYLGVDIDFSKGYETLVEKVLNVLY
ncbi:MAG: tetraacyldisaccharide 4'-kinase [Bdellovibrionales bacterium RIFOXYD12_FULL_39_22]|nr:MAG: tetraacyldisaccharide 4'-kinase [Bdellovibrionales bacterium RIFOXYB1_FULL_39_21]OFZ41577.1 MAG: tetraacyldisaccharide 4'-kinase [Bdellovibrionales bacterium RIFOXYC12_FULL_39_17]OFZ45890.1 MAG: tetraacyldisaccharide 4'-kinase [Bdellovibrionales bacterium RIFOXYC1_FULL_39_130]OFZ74822.1 MAG: tetraacyldisaccharide 4'-kinase [Bdellovibrionales bacterium RIFOXYD1_FULL_39_84]OFZ92682.1 MAG: tetraacyldisaccharide 4'-kinase [Bdellovibrionales bacterium RIFOXYD12_FULL_39_22]HLE11269.1 tetraac